MKSVFPVAAPVFLAAVFASQPANAATANRSFTVSATVLASCATSTSSMSLRPAAGTAEGSSASISVNCTQATPYVVGLSSQIAPNAPMSTSGVIRSGNTLLGYALRPDNQGVVIWSRTAVGDRVAGVEDGAVRQIPLLAAAQSDQYLETSTSADTVVLTITY